MVMITRPGFDLWMGIFPYFWSENQDAFSGLWLFYFHSLLLWTLRLWSRDPKGVPKLCLKTIDLLLPFSLKNPSFYERAAKQGQLATNRSGPKIWFILLFVFEFYIKKPVFMNIWGNFFLCMGKLCPLLPHPQENTKLKPLQYSVFSPFSVAKGEKGAKGPINCSF